MSRRNERQSVLLSQPLLLFLIPSQEVVQVLYNIEIHRPERQEGPSVNSLAVDPGGVLLHTPGDGTDEVHGNGTFVFGGIELVVMADLSQQLQGHQRGDLNGERTERCSTIGAPSTNGVGPGFIINTRDHMGQKLGEASVTSVSTLNWATCTKKNKTCETFQLLGLECMFHFLVWQMREEIK